MAQRDYSDHQHRIIKKYYNQLDTIMLQKLQELVGELYLADTDAQRRRLWQRVEKAMVNLKIPPDIMAHILAQKDVEVLARNLQDWLKQAKK
jgi:hypothetical protein